jgi:transcriptional regulator GlxA family with amidase domain
MFTITFLFYDGMTALDAIGPHEILSRLPEVSIQRVALQAGPINTSSGLILTADHAFTDVTHTDVLCMPGASNATTLHQYPELLEWIKALHKTTTWTTSVCTGSLILGAAGLLKNIKATTHWAVMDRLATWGAIPTSKRVVEDGKLITAAGVSAGLDMALILAEKLAGKTVAETLQLVLEYDPKPPFDVGAPEKADPAILSALRARLKKSMQETLD